MLHDSKEQCSLGAAAAPRPQQGGGSSVLSLVLGPRSSVLGPWLSRHYFLIVIGRVQACNVTTLLVTSTGLLHRYPIITCYHLPSRKSGGKTKGEKRRR